MKVEHATKNTKRAKGGAAMRKHFARQSSAAAAAQAPQNKPNSSGTQKLEQAPK